MEQHDIPAPEEASASDLLHSYFAPSTTVTPTPDVFAHIGRVLRSTGHATEWYENPRIYYILRRIRREDLMEKITFANYTDLWLPFPKRMLQTVLGDKDLKTFIDIQKTCLDERPDPNLNGQHYSFEDSSIMEFQLLKVLGAGGYGEVEHVRDPRNGNEYARKVMIRPSHATRHHDLMDQFKRELAGMRRVCHLHCVTLKASFTDSDSVAIFSTPVADMDLAAFLNLDLNVSQLSELRKAVGCITAALSYLHEQGIRHDDLKPNNILIYRHQVLLTDFGFCLDSSDTGISTTTGAPTHFVRRYSAPEVFEHEPRSRLTDIWGLGCVLFEVLSRLRGFKLQEMRMHWLRSGSKYDSFAENSDATEAWFTGLSENRTRMQHGSRRKELLMISYVYRVILEKNRLSRPTARQVLSKLFDLDFMYPDSTFAWVGECCLQQMNNIVDDQKETAADDIQFQGHVPQWPLLDLTMVDDHLAFLVLDKDLNQVANSQNVSFLYETLPKDSDEKRLWQRILRNDIDTIKTASESMLQASKLNIMHTSTSSLMLEHMMKSSFINSLSNTTFWVGFLNIYWADEVIPRLRTVQLSLSMMCLERQKDHGQPYFIIAFDPNEGEVVEGSYQRGKNIWTDGLSGFFIPSNQNRRYEQLQKRKRKYEAIQAHVRDRQHEYLRLLEERRSIKKGLENEHTKCLRCTYFGIECSGPSGGGSCEQCLAQNPPSASNLCKFDINLIRRGGLTQFEIDVIERGGVPQRYIDSKEHTRIDRMVTERWGS